MIKDFSVLILAATLLTACAPLESVPQQQTTQQIADKIYLSKRTVEGYRVKILEKIQAKNIAGVVIFALKNNIIKEEDVL